MTRAGTLVCIVDDDLSVRRGLQRLVHSFGFRTQTFPSALAYLDAYEHLDVSCLVLDVHLGGMSGLDLLEELGARGATTPVIVITAYDEAASEQRARRGGAVAYLRKPFDDAAMLEAISRAVRSPAESEPA
jgi:FixJ family two-component response regulator